MKYLLKHREILSIDTHSLEQSQLAPSPTFDPWTTASTLESWGAEGRGKWVSLCSMSCTVWPSTFGSFIGYDRVWFWLVQSANCQFYHNVHFQVAAVLFSWYIMLCRHDIPSYGGLKPWDHTQTTSPQLWLLHFASWKCQIPLPLQTNSPPPSDQFCFGFPCLIVKSSTMIVFNATPVLYLTSSVSLQQSYWWPVAAVQTAQHSTAKLPGSFETVWNGDLTWFNHQK